MLFVSIDISPSEDFKLMTAAPPSARSVRGARRTERNQHVHGHAITAAPAAGTVSGADADIFSDTLSYIPFYHIEEISRASVENIRFYPSSIC